MRIGSFHPISIPLTQENIERRQVTMFSRLNEVSILSSVLLLHSSSHLCRAEPSIEPWEIADTLATEDQSFLHSGPADNHNLLPINSLPDDGNFPSWFRDSDSRHWFTDEALNQWFDNTPPTQSRSSTPDQAIQHPSPDEDFFRANTLSSLISPDKTASHELSEAGSSHPNVPGKRRIFLLFFKKKHIN